MDIDSAEATFGARGVQGVRFELPMVLTDRESVLFFFFFSLFSPSRAIHTSLSPGIPRIVSFRLASLRFRVLA